MESFPQPGSAPDSIDESLERKKPGADWKSNMLHGNVVQEQIRAYAAHVQEMVEKTGRTATEVVDAEKEDIRKAGGVAKFLGVKN